MASTTDIPLAERMRPQSLSDFFGQAHILSAEQGLYQSLQKGELHSCILWGPPGTGKTTLAEIMARHSSAQLLKLSAVDAGVKEVRLALEQAEQYRTIVFVDEIHRFNTRQQDTLLSAIESGLITFIGATTENPSFSCNNALLSRCQVHILKGLDEQALQDIIHRALHTDVILSERRLTIAEDALAAIIDHCDGDARKALLSLELVSQSLANNTAIALADVKATLGSKIARFDKDGDYFYDLLSAFHKSVRGSSSDGALYWFARFLQVNKDPTPIMRRLLAIASEDIGLADPKALSLCLNAWDTYHRVGAAEGERAIAQACVYCALAPKSNALYNAFKKAKRSAAESSNASVPVHLRNAPTQLAKAQGHGANYRYSHNEEHAYSAGQTYLPDDVVGDFYVPNERGLEQKLAQKIAFLKSLEQGKYS